MTTTTRPSKRRFTRLRKGTLDLLAYNVREKEALAEVGTIEAQASKKRPAQNDNEQEAPPAKRIAASKSSSKSSTEPAIEGPGRAAQRLKGKLMEVIDEQEEISESAEKSDFQEADAEESEVEKFIEPLSHEGANQGKFTLFKKVKDSQPISDALPQNPASRVTKHSGKTVTFVPTPHREPSRRMSAVSS